LNRPITPGENGWTYDAPRILRGIAAKNAVAHEKAEEPEMLRRRETAELNYYEENHCYPRQTGYFGTETDAHYYER
jgi:hypothetical protein